VSRDLRRRLELRRRPRLGSLRRTTPISARWGADRGTPIDRYYIEQFLAEHSTDIRGRVLEVGDRRYTERFGSGVSWSDVLDIDQANPDATIVADLAHAPGVGSDCFECLILTQTLQFVFPVEAAIREAHRLLRSGGVLLATVPAVSRVDRHAGVDGDFWRFTAASCHRLFGAVFGEAALDVRAYGNVLAAIGFLTGLAREDLSDAELDERDELFPVVVGVRAVKA
jgi:SAM-dependent methyltransferase